MDTRGYQQDFMITVVRGGVKKQLFFLLSVKRGGGGVLGQSKKSLSENTQIFFDLGGVLPNPKGFYQKKTEIFWHNLPKKGGFIKKTGIF